ncbi:hypothetical protein CTAYLR_004647 [Chrysophaeum taylorii]|uniref:Tyrosinase copper-binding domain-containing protein n=1 Tax=Chrysophaeum taylorii TaxID=2483200 RepID=A0AAD7XNJ1_9STRA|nr:hypothetical protein CTAYLR_004647 [Chrysophaeum taylorii]
MVRYARIDDDDDDNQGRYYPASRCFILLLGVAAIISSRWWWWWIATKKNTILSISSSSEDEEVLNVEISNLYEVAARRKIGDGLYPYEYLAEIHRETTLRATPGVACEWELDDETIVTGCVATRVWTSVGQKIVRVTADATKQREIRVYVKYVRRELRELDVDDRERYLSAVAILYRVDTDVGARQWGPNYKSAAWLVREHLYGAASRECDHWHDDAGFLNHHVGITFQFERSIQAVDAAVSASYWDYTIDASESFSKSLVFATTWFGPASPPSDSHVVDSGRFAYAPVPFSSSSFSTIKNPYGLLRSPWNTNPVPYLLRFDQVLGMKHDGYLLTTCEDFAATLDDDEKTSLSVIVSRLNGKLHGPIHIMIGGHWWFDNNTASWLGTTEGARSRALLASKFLWRQGYLRCPETCSADADFRACACSCPAADDAYQVLRNSGLLDINKSWRSPEKNDWRKILEFLCHVGHPGDMFTSAAPQDPIFWPLHGNAERFVHLVRLLRARGEKVSTNRPTCDRGETCPGHKKNDLLPFRRGLFDDDDDDDERHLTNAEFYNLTSPLNPDLPYVYDRLTYWPACRDQTIWHHR